MRKPPPRQVYTIVTRAADGAEETTTGDFDGDADAIRWAYYYLGLDKAAVARVHRGWRPADRPFAEIHAPEG